MTHHIVHPITEALRHRRLQRGLTVASFAKQANLSRNSVSSREEKKFPALAALDKWARNLGYQLVLLDIDKK
jgi:transcriptional regulator with XRE-family HTH domain